MADDPNTQHGCPALWRTEWDAKHVDIAKAVVSAPRGLIRARRMITQGLAEDIRVRARDAQQRVEYARLCFPSRCNGLSTYSSIFTPRSAC